MTHNYTVYDQNNYIQDSHYLLKQAARMKKKVAWKLSAAGNLRLSLPHFIALFPPEMDGSRSLKVAIFFRWLPAFNENHKIQEQDKLICITKKLDTNKADQINLSKMLGLIFRCRWECSWRCYDKDQGFGWRTFSHICKPATSTPRIKYKQDCKIVNGMATSLNDKKWKLGYGCLLAVGQCDDNSSFNYVYIHLI